MRTRLTKSQKRALIKYNKDKQVTHPSSIHTAEFYKTDREVEDTWLAWIARNALTEEEYNNLHFKFIEDPELYDLSRRYLLPRCEFSGAGLVKGIPHKPKYIDNRRVQNDEVPARLSDGEFVFRAKAVDQIGAYVLQDLMDKAERDFDNGFETILEIKNDRKQEF